MPKEGMVFVGTEGRLVITEQGEALNLFIQNDNTLEGVTLLLPKTEVDLLISHLIVTRLKEKQIC